MISKKLVKDIIGRIQHRFGPPMMEWFSGAVAATFGVILLVGDNVIDLPEWSWFADFFHEQGTFGRIMIALGAARLVALGINGALIDVTPLIRQVSAFCGLLVWFAIAVGFYLSGVLTVWAAFYPWLVIAELTNIYRAAHDQGEVRNGVGRIH